ncbi:hypothetical protein BDB01DRAFT_833369 [Pilobolus umbonatus]|nr:hypothetical protein BDB01DRAFT_833369 [Pilobolus umbonatus]
MACGCIFSGLLSRTSVVAVELVVREDVTEETFFLVKPSLYSLILPSISYLACAMFQTEGEGRVSSFVYLSFIGYHEQHSTNKTYCDISLISKGHKEDSYFLA